MKDLSTLVIDDEERTLVSPKRPPTGSSTPDVWHRLRSSALGVPSRWRAIAGSFVVLVAVGWAVAERRRSEELLAAIAGSPASAEVLVVDSIAAGPRPPRRRAIPPTESTVAVSVEPELPIRDAYDAPESMKPGVAIDAILRNELEEALATYVQLAVQRPDERVYSHVVEVLEAKLACKRGSSDAGASCAE